MTTLASRTEGSTRRRAREAPEGPVGRTTGWWGMVLFICTESATFAAILASYFYLRFIHDTPWPPPGDRPPSLPVPTVGTVVLLLSCLPMLLAGRTGRRPRVHGLMLLLALLGGVVFVVLQGVDYSDEWPASTLHKDAYGSLFYTITGLHVLHVVIGLFMVLLVLVGGAVRGVGRGHLGSVRVVAMYWYFLSVLAVAVYATVYLSPHL